MKGGLDQVFGVQTAYAVDLGLGGTILDFSNISPALTARIEDSGLFGEEGSTRTALREDHRKSRITTALRPALTDYQSHSKSQRAAVI